MEIKIVETILGEGQHQFDTFICEGDNIHHKKIYFNSKTEFLNKYNGLTKNLEGGVLGIPEDYWLDKGEKDIKGYFIFCLYDDKYDNLKFIVFKNRKMYVTNKGTTVDIVE